MKYLQTLVVSMIAFTFDGGASAQPQAPDAAARREAAAAAQRLEREAQAEAQQQAREAELVAQRAEREAQAAARRAEAQAELGADRAELEAARARLEQARSELEAAAQELARLSAEQYGQLENRFVFDRNFFASQRAHLGLNITSDEDGVRVIGVSPNGPGSAAGVEIGDLIVSVDDLDVSGSSAGNSTRLFLDRLGQVDVGEAVTVGILRDGEPLELSIVTADRFDPQWTGEFADHAYRAVRNVQVVPFEGQRVNRTRTRPVFVGGGWSDMELIELSPELGAYFGTEEGLLVVRAPDSGDENLRAGDVILQIGERTPQSVGHAMRILTSFEPGESLQLTIMREQRRREIDVAVPTREGNVVVVAPAVEPVR